MVISFSRFFIVYPSQEYTYSWIRARDRIAYLRAIIKCLLNCSTRENQTDTQVRGADVFTVQLSPISRSSFGVRLSPADCTSAVLMRLRSDYQIYRISVFLCCSRTCESYGFRFVATAGRRVTIDW